MSLSRRIVMTKIQILFSTVILFACACAIAQGQVTTRQMGTRRTTGNGDPGTGSYTVPATSGPDSKGPDTVDPEQQKIWNAARQLDLDSDQRAQLSSSLKEQKDETATVEKALQEARAALAHALQNGQTSLESEIEDLASASAKVQESQLRQWAALYAVLTPDQQRRLLMMPTPLSRASTTLPGVSQAQSQ
jgi:Spy/CpxP family protein refolding chaperone